jgi:diadenosine tetraphosphate (Ap4A) HIT family hydrolase
MHCHVHVIPRYHGDIDNSHGECGVLSGSRSFKVKPGSQQDYFLSFINTISRTPFRTL